MNKFKVYLSFKFYRFENTTGDMCKYYYNYMPPLSKT